MPPETGPRGTACDSSLRDGAAATGRDSLAGRGLRGDLRASDALTGAAAVVAAVLDAAGDGATVADATRGALAGFDAEAVRGAAADAATGAEAEAAPDAATAPEASDAGAACGVGAPAGNGNGLKPAATATG
jgi:hypothetical protein